MRWRRTRHGRDATASRGIATLAAVCAVLASAPVARAQSSLDGSAYAFPVPDYVGAIVGTNTLDPGTGSSGASGQPSRREQRIKPPTRRQLATLRFSPTPAVTQRVYQRVIDHVGTGVDPAVLTGQLDAAKASFRAVLDRLGWRSSDLGDVAAFSLVQSYATWHEVAVLPPAGLKALRREVRDNLARQKRVRRLPGARKQEIAEILELRVIFFLDARNDAAAAGDSAGVAAARSEMRLWAKSIFGADVDDLRLTRRGLVER